MKVKLTINFNSLAELQEELPSTFNSAKSTSTFILSIYNDDLLFKVKKVEEWLFYYPSFMRNNKSLTRHLSKDNTRKVLVWDDVNQDEYPIKEKSLTVTARENGLKLPLNTSNKASSELEILSYMTESPLFEGFDIEKLEIISS